MSAPATARQREHVAALITRSGTVDEVSRLIRGLKRERVRLKDLLRAIIEANRGGNRKRLGALLVELKGRTAHGEWLPILAALAINPRRAQRLMKTAGG